MFVCWAGDGDDLARGTRVKCPPTLLLPLRRAHFRREATPPSSSPGTGVSDWACRAQEGETDIRFGRLSRGCYLARKLSSLQENAQNAKPRRRGLTIRAALLRRRRRRPKSHPRRNYRNYVRTRSSRPGDTAWTLYRQAGAATSAPPRVPNCSRDILGLRGRTYIRGSSARAHGSSASHIGPGLYPQSAPSHIYPKARARPIQYARIATHNQKVAQK